MDREVILYCFLCRASHVGVKEDDFPEKCPECNRKTKWTKTADSEDNKAYEWDDRNTNNIDAEKNKASTLDKYKKRLEDQNLLNLILQEIGKKVVGEKETVKAIFIHGCGIWVKNHQVASYNLHINDQPGLGKDFVMKSTFDIFPEGNKVYRTKITPQLLAYWHNAKFEPDWTWNDKILYLEDISDEILKSDVFKIMASSGTHATILIKQKPVDIKINGKPVILITSYNANPNDENLRRFPIVGCDETENQTLKIMQKQAQDAIMGEENPYNEEIQGALSLLTPRRVKIPFADKLPEYFPQNRFMRTHFHRFLDLIKASAALHQFQREKENGCICANRDDYRIARDVLLKTTSNNAMVPLTKIQKEFLEYFKIHRGRHSVSDIQNNFPYTDKTLRFHLDKLFSYGLLKKDKENRANSTKPVMIYEYNGEDFDIEIPRVDAILPILPDLDGINTARVYDTEDNNDKISKKGIINKIDKNSNIGKSSNFDTIGTSLKELGFNDTQITQFFKIFEVMRNKPSHEWYIGKLGDETGMQPLQIKDLLINLTRNPKNPTPVRAKDERGDCYILDRRDLYKIPECEEIAYKSHSLTKNKEVII